MKLLPILLVLVALVGRAGPHVDKDTRLVFPEKVGAWVKAGTEVYPQPALGYAVGYHGENRKVITLYVYDEGLPDIPSGASSPQVAIHFKEVAAGIQRLWSKEGATVTEVMAPRVVQLKGGKSAAVVMAHKIEFNGKVLHSISALTGYRRKFVKLRYTYPGPNLEAGLGEVGEFALVLLNANSDTLDPYFKVPAPAPKPEQR